MDHVSFVPIAENTFARVRRNYGSSGERWTVTIQIYESELDDMGEVRMVEFTVKVDEIVTSLQNLINHASLEKNQDPDPDNGRGHDVPPR